MHDRSGDGRVGEDRDGDGNVRSGECNDATGTTGTVDPRLGQMARLSELYCYKNRFTGTVPSEVGRLACLKILTVRPR